MCFVLLDFASLVWPVAFIDYEDLLRFSRHCIARRDAPGGTCMQIRVRVDSQIGGEFAAVDREIDTWNLKDWFELYWSQVDLVDKVLVGLL